ncbi:MAG: hypothetical protein IPJ03_06185 [Ignavibacteriales bacterium]|nr:hypothetical protein [Ignavibacteriales bacterium]
MNENKIIELINLYFDGELDKSREITLFALLSSDQYARDYFKQLSVIRNAVDNSREELPLEVGERILRSVEAKTSQTKGIVHKANIFSAIYYAAALILLLLSGYLFLKVSSFQERVDTLSEQMIIQNRTIELLYNSLPGIEVRATLDNEIIIKPNI